MVTNITFNYREYKVTGEYILGYAGDYYEPPYAEGFEIWYIYDEDGDEVSDTFSQLELGEIEKLCIEYIKDSQESAREDYYRSRYYEDK